MKIIEYKLTDLASVDYCVDFPIGDVKSALRIEIPRDIQWDEVSLNPDREKACQELFWRLLIPLICKEKDDD